MTGRAPRRRTWRFWLAVALSLLVHLAVILALLVSIRREEVSELLPPPSPVTMVFESGRKSGPTVPQPSEQATPSRPVPVEPTPAPTAPPQPPAPPLVQPPPVPPPVQQEVPPPPVPPPIKQEVAPPVTPAPPPQALPAPPAPPQPETEAPPAPPLPVVPTVPPQAPPAPVVPQSPATEALPPPPPAPPPIPRLVQPAPPPLPVKPAPPRAAVRPAPSTAFPPPMNYSFGTPVLPLDRPSPTPRPAPHPRGSIDLSLGPAAKGQADITPFGPHANDAEGADWRNALSQWVAEHAYYPPEAVRQLEEGDSKVHVVMQPNGKVTSVELIGRSGSVWLDTALVALFRDQHIPPLPGGENEPFEFDFTMRYILRRMLRQGAP